MSEEKGRISVETENIFPIIKKWLYSEKDIFIRELVSNAMDAITKLKKIALSEEFEGETEYKVSLGFDKDKRTLWVEDNGVGMSADEVKKYINQIAFSGAEDFVKKYQTEGQAGIIGHFGLGFYSSFMVSTKVSIESLSYKKGSKPIIWVSEGGTEFSLKEGDKNTRGTKITLYLDSESGEYLDKWKIKELVKKYCDFLPVPIEVDGEDANRKKALWSDSPSSVKKEDYTEFYNYLFPFSGEPHFWVHLNVDYPFKLQGILYFPKLKHELDVAKNGVKLYCNEVFVSDEASELIPQFLTILKGTIDIPDLPLNVSRSYLQNDPLVKKISSHIIKKISDRLNEEFNKDRKAFESIWDDISLFVKYGMMTDEKFFEGVEKLLLYKTSEGNYLSLEEYWHKNREKNKDRVYYTNETEGASVYMDLFRSQGIEAIFTDSRIDSHFIQFLETKQTDRKFMRLDAELADQLLDTNAKPGIVDSGNQTEADRIREMFNSSIGREGLEIKVEALKSEEVPAVIIMPEYIRRLSEMNMGMNQDRTVLLKNHTLVVNSSSPLVKNALRLSAGVQPEKANLVTRQIYDLALLAAKVMTDQEVGEFLKRASKTLETITKDN